MVPPSSVAVVNGQQITQAQFQAGIAQAESQLVAQGGTKPAPGTPQYTSMQNQVVAYLVQVAEVEQSAKKLGLSVTPKEVNKFISDYAKAHFNGSMKQLVAYLKSQGVTLQQAQQQVEVTLLQDKIKKRVTAGAKVSVAQEQLYYQQHKFDQFTVNASTTRSVQYIIIKCNPKAVAGAPPTPCTAKQIHTAKQRADMVAQKLQNGASFGELAKKYSDDPTTAPGGGKYTLTKGQAVPVFEQVGFGLRTGQQTAKPVDATSKANNYYGFFLIKALAPVKKVKKHVTPFKQAQSTIKQTLLSQQQETKWQQWVSKLVESYKGKVTYQTGYAPPTTTALPTTTNGTPTG